MNPTRNAAIYARISQDRDGKALGVNRQLADCRAEAKRRGWAVAGEFVDDDVSAYSGARRPQYQRLLQHITDQIVDAVIVWHIDRLHRRPLELEHFVQTCAAAGLTDVVTLHGDFNLGTGDGLLVARLLSAVAANESDSKSRRARRKMQEIAESGRPHGGGNRPFGFAEDRISHLPAEARVIKVLASRALAGETLTSLGKWLEAEGVTTVRGKAWRGTTIRALLINPRIYGMRTYRGDVLGRAVWKPIIPAEQGEALRALLTDPARRTNRSARRYLLSGLCRCSKCGSVMYSTPRYGVRRYVCRSGPGLDGCGGTTIHAQPVELVIAEAVLQRLDGPELQDALAGRVKELAGADDLTTLIAQDTAQLDELATLYSDRRVTAPEWLKAREPIERRRTESRRKLAQLSGAAVIDGYIGNGGELRRQWPELNLDRQRAIVKAIVDHVVILPGEPGSHSVRIERIRPVWRL